ALDDVAQRADDDLAGRREDDRAIERLRLGGPTRPHRPHAKREGLRGVVAVAREGVDLATVGGSDLRDDLRRGTEAVEAEPPHADATAAVVDTDDLVPDDERQLRLRKLAVDDVKVGAADRAGAHPDADLTGAWHWRRDVAQRQWLALTFEEHGSHISSVA